MRLSNLQMTLAVPAMLLAISGSAMAQLTVIPLPGTQYRYGKISSFSSGGTAFTGYVISDGPGGDSAPRAFTYSSLTSAMLLDSDNYTIGLAVSNDGTDAVRAVGSISGVGILPIGSKLGSMVNPAESSTIAFRAIAANDVGQLLVGFDPAVSQSGGFSRRQRELGTVISLPTVQEAPNPRVTTVSRDGQSMSINYYRQVFEAPVPALWTASGGLVELNGRPDAAWAATRQISGDGSVVVGFSSIEVEPFLFETVGGYWAVSNGVPSAFVEVGGFNRIDFVSFDGSVMFGYSDLGESVWTRTDGLMPLSQYLGRAGVALPSDWQYLEIGAISPDGRSFAGFGTLADGITDVAFTISIPSPAAGVLLVFAKLAAFRRRR